MVEDHLDVSSVSCRAGGCYGLPVGLELEAARLLALVVLEAVGVASGKADLFVPEGGKVECALCPGHADERDLAAGSRQTQRVLHGAWCADALEDPARSTHNDGLAKLGLVWRRAQHLGELRVGLSGVDYLGCSQTKCFFPLSLVLGDADNATGVGQVPQGGDGEETDAAGPDHQGGVFRGRGCL